MRGASLTLRCVSRRFDLPGGEPVRALDEVSIEVAAGSAVAITGPSGSGKSTLLHVVGAIESVDAGEVVIGGRDLARLPAKALTQHRRSAGLVFQRFNLIASLTALDNVLAPVLVYRTDFDKQQRARELLARVGLEGRERSLPSRMSGGQQQRVAIARALVNRPRLLLADEPTGNLDSATGELIVDLLLGLRDELGMTVLLATHDARIAARCDRIVELRDGRIVDDVAIAAAPDELRRLAEPPQER